MTFNYTGWLIGILPNITGFWSLLIWPIAAQSRTWATRPAPIGPSLRSFGMKTSKHHWTMSMIQVLGDVLERWYVYTLPEGLLRLPFPSPLQPLNPRSCPLLSMEPKNYILRLIKGVSCADVLWGWLFGFLGTFAQQDSTRCMWDWGCQQMRGGHLDLPCGASVVWVTVLSLLYAADGHLWGWLLPCLVLAFSPLHL